jgi:hypothetical protein
VKGFVDNNKPEKITRWQFLLLQFMLMQKGQQKIDPQKPEEAKETNWWQRTLLPFMLLMLGGLTIAFVGMSFFQFQELQSFMTDKPKIATSSSFTTVDKMSLSEKNRLQYEQVKGLIILEKYSLDQRYHQANILLLASTWTRYQGFITGMVLALVGATFILGKLREDTSNLNVKNSGNELSLQSTSPGLILTFLGSVLMLTALLTRSTIETKDVPIYTNFSLPDREESPLAPPLVFPDSTQPNQTNKSGK